MARGNFTPRPKLPPEEQLKKQQFWLDPKNELQKLMLEWIEYYQSQNIPQRQFYIWGFMAWAEKNGIQLPPHLQVVDITPDDISAMRREISELTRSVQQLNDGFTQGLFVGTAPKQSTKRSRSDPLSNDLLRVLDSTVGTGIHAPLDED